MRLSALIAVPVLLTAAATTSAQTPPAGAFDNAELGALMQQNMQNMTTVGVAMTAVGEVCGLSTAAQSQTALVSFREQMVKEGGRAEDVDAIYRQSLREGRARAAANPQEMKRHCDGLRQMGSPDTLRQLESLNRALEGLNR